VFNISRGQSVSIRLVSRYSQPSIQTYQIFIVKRTAFHVSTSYHLILHADLHARAVLNILFRLYLSPSSSIGGILRNKSRTGLITRVPSTSTPDRFRHLCSTRANSIFTREVARYVFILPTGTICKWKKEKKKKKSFNDLYIYISMYRCRIYIIYIYIYIYILTEEPRKWMCNMDDAC